MSRIGKQPIPIPQGVKIALEDRDFRSEGPKGKLTAVIPTGVKVVVEGQEVRVGRESDSRRDRALHGLTRMLLANMVNGVGTGFRRVLEINGVGYRAEVKGTVLHLSLGYSHPVEFPLPAGVAATVERQTMVILESADRQLVGQTAARIRALRGPEPYKGKGIKYQEEVVRRKAGKAVGA